jgi:hypothetical protein
MIANRHMQCLPNLTLVVLALYSTQTDSRAALLSVHLWSVSEPQRTP